MPRPKVAQVDVARLEQLARVGATNYEIAHVLGVATATLDRQLQREQVRAAMEKGKAELYTSLRTKQVQLAMAGNVTMLIWLGKQYLGQKDKQEFSGVDGGAIELNVSAREHLLSRIAGLAQRK